MRRFWISLQFLPLLTVNLVPLGKGLEYVPLLLEMFGNASHHAGHVFQSLIGVSRDRPMLFSEFMELLQEQGLPHAALS